MAKKQTYGEIINDLEPGTFKTLVKVNPMGALQARKLATGAVTLYWRYSIGTKSERVLIGLYDSTASPKGLEPTEDRYSIAAAIHAAEVHATAHHKHRNKGGRPALLAAARQAEQDAAEALRQAEQQAADAKRQAAENTLEKLLLAYCDHLKKIGRRSHSDARSIFNLHVIAAWPEVAVLPAKDVTGEQIADMMRKLNEAGKGRTANKLRSYARAAYQTAKAAKSKASVPVAFKGYGITTNPVADTEPDESQNRPDKRPLSADELRTYWKAIKPLAGFQGAVLRLHLLTGGQRIEQLVSLRTDKIEPDAITLLDGKGRPGSLPRPHTVPLTADAAKALEEIQATGTYALSNGRGTKEGWKKGDRHIAAPVLSKWAADAVGDSIKNFQAKRLRSGVETLLSSAGVSQEIRGRLQSHGISGVQARHYDGHDYLQEKRAALETLHALLELQEAGNVVDMTKKRAAR